nr:ABC transporter ATP-binding protein [Candidatus Njordarchaeota archaeon]
MSVDVTVKLNNTKHDLHGNNDDEAALTVRTLSLTKVFPANKISSLLKLNSHGEVKVAVDNLNMKVPRGAVYGYLGPNGAGKTTTIRMLVGLLKPTRGTASICGHTIHDDLRGAQQHMGYMPDIISKFPPMKAVEFLTLFGELSGLNNGTARRRALDLLSWGNLDDATTLNTKVNKWSAGMQRKLLLIQAMLHNPDVLLLDEPTANLDPVARRELIELLKRVTNGDAADAGDRGWRTTVFLSSHDLQEVEEVATHLGFLNRGVLVAEDTKEKMRKAIGAATTGAPTFRITGENLMEVAKQVEDKLQAKLVNLSNTELTVATKHGDKLLSYLAEVAQSNPEVKVTNMTQKEDSLEEIFLKLARLTPQKEWR